MTKMNEQTSGLLAFFLGIALTLGYHFVAIKDCKKVIKTDIGEFIIDGNKIYSVYQLERSVKGDLQVGIK